MIIGHTIGATLVVVVAAFAFNLPARRLLVPFLLLVWCGPVLSSLIIGAELARAQSKAYVLRLALAVFAYLEMLMFAFLFSAVWLGMVSQADALAEYLPRLTDVILIASILSYFVLRNLILSGKPRPPNRGDTMERPQP